jgi:hypothetical protein
LTIGMFIVMRRRENDPLNELEWYLKIFKKPSVA